MAAADSLTAEKLIVLRNYTQGLLTRTHALVKYSAGQKVDVLPTKIKDALNKRSEDPLTNIEKVALVSLLDLQTRSFF